MLETKTEVFSNQPLQNAWLLRWNQRIEESMMALAEVQTFQQWTHLEIQDLGLQSPGLVRELYLEALLLKGSLWRAQGQEKKSSTWLRRILTKCEELQNPLSFRLLFELGLDCWRQEDVPQALDYFLLAERKTRNITEQVFTQSNILWALECLDLDRKQFEMKVQDSLTRVPKDKLSEVRNVYEQWTAYLLRKEFYQNLHLQNPESSGQSLFFNKWAQSLPYSANSSEEIYNLNSPYLWQGSYRLRTLAGIWSPTDKSCLRIGDGIDRLYLWVWKWMAGQEILKEKLIWTLDSILEQLDLSELSKENALLFRNALSWMAVLDEAFAKRHSKILNRVQNISSVNYPVLNTEFALICCLSTNDSEDLRSSLQQFPVFDQILKQSLSSQDPVLLPRLREVLREKNKFKNSRYDVIVNFQTSEIRVTTNGKTIRSKKLITLLHSLHKNNRVRLSEIPNESEDPRFVYNLLGRLRKILPEQSFIVENGYFVKSSLWPSIQFIHTEDSDHTDFTHHESYQSKNYIVGSDSYLQAAKALLAKPFLRKEMETALKISKATACRMLEDWILQGLIIKSGQAKAVRYSWRNDV